MTLRDLGCNLKERQSSLGQSLTSYVVDVELNGLKCVYGKHFLFCFILENVRKVYRNLFRKELKVKWVLGLSREYISKKWTPKFRT